MSVRQVFVHDGQRWGGCEYCEATYRIVLQREGITHMRITHQRSCPVVLRRLYEWSGEIHGEANP